MAITVSKFGGSSLADAGCFLRVGRILSAGPAREIAVVSAPGRRTEDDDKSTDLLIRFCDTLDESVWQVIAGRFTEIAAEIAPGLKMPELLREIHARIRDTRDCAYAMSRGEYLAARILAESTGRKFIDAADVIRIAPGGTTNMAATRALLTGLRQVPAVIPGFYGADAHGRIVVYPRGGSDITGAVVAACLGAQQYENWTDVNGLSPVAPKYVPDTWTFEYASYRFLHLLARTGTTLIHPDGVAPVWQAGIPLVIRNTFAPQNPGTRVGEAEMNPPAAAVAGRADVCALSLLASDAAGRAADFGGAADWAFHDGACVTLVFSGEDAHARLDEAGAALAGDSTVLRVRLNQALIAVLGVRGSADAVRILRILDALHVRVTDLCLISAQKALLLLVEREKMQRGITGIYRNWVQRQREKWSSTAGNAMSPEPQ